MFGLTSNSIQSMPGHQTSPYCDKTVEADMGRSRRLRRSLSSPMEPVKRMIRKLPAAGVDWAPLTCCSLEVSIELAKLLDWKSTGNSFTVMVRCDDVAKAGFYTKELIYLEQLCWRFCYCMLV